MCAIKLNSEQENVLDGLKKFTHCSKESEIIIDAGGGTGKTTVIMIFLRSLILDEFTVALTAPTHDAVSVLEKRNPGVDCVTIHKLLDLYVDDGKLTKGKAKYWKKYDIVFLDEVSMIDQFVLKYLNSYISITQTKFVYSGDKLQLPPVNETISAIYKKDLKMLTMQTNMRSMDESISKYRDFDNFPLESGDFISLEEMIGKYNELDGRKVILCWTNELCDTINKLINGGRSDFEVNDKIICIKTNQLSGHLIYSGEEIKISKIDGNIINGNIVVREGYYGHGHAITVHKSQGKTYDYVFIAEKNIRRCPYYKNSLYTAVSRTKNKYYFFNSTL